MPFSHDQIPPMENDTPKAHQVFLALGTNLGERKQNLEAALHQLSKNIEIKQVSSIYETEPVGYADQPNFFNLVCSGQTMLPVDKLHQETQKIEQQLGRQPSFRNGPRLIDIDILFYDQAYIERATLIIPHPRLHERAFVLAPLAEIAPDYLHPTLGKSARELLDTVNVQGFFVSIPNHRAAC
ncbi:2-amino-4-hydroxy-6-hydroxymethyldihydropteridine diphosphokinase [Ktedonospora formicarum]|uniref:2-amino-4-hydroxy-6-hydroxymethyldihydropteridine diphosphokinase n=1 Tax=Ktedonospora formicarum TaxID=2778364 RepID=A0A8J3MXT1_9CHLR|nr:2-amino-4-hydroxy-6-hydroxymethyldihydropteridine diphosphokinase [Ktedonospora formicarum]GHO50038.1 2-amino-4-hydroxy-6-hydroxymethyldihydropteridine diphosphokinase [Ktedonospora formicarum]